MKDLKIGTRLVAGFAIVISITFAFGALAYIKTASPDPAVDQLTKVSMPAVYLGDDLRNSAQTQYALFQQFLSAANATEQDRLEGALKSERSRNADLMARFESLSTKSDTSLKSAQDAFQKSADSVIRAAKATTEDVKKTALPVQSDATRLAYEEYLKQADSLVTASRSAADEQHPSSDGSRILLWLAIAILFCFALSSFIIRSVTGPLALATRMLNHASEGDLAYRAEVTSNDELGELLTALNKQLENQSIAAGIVDRLADGELSVQINMLSEKDALGSALVRLRNGLMVSVEIAERIAEGNLTPAKGTISDKDKLATTLVGLRDRIKGTVDLAEKICEGDLKADVKPLSDVDHLAQALLRMRVSLQTGIRLAATLAEGDLSADVNGLPKTDTLGGSLRRLQSFLMTASQAVDKIADGDLSVSVTPISANDVLGHSLSRMVETLRHHISQVVLSADHIGSVSGDVISSAAQLSNGSCQHSAAAAETSSVIGGLAMSLRHSAGNSQQSEKLATSAAEEGTLGGEAVNRTVAVMKEVAERINLVDDIARKTDMLTLAAAVEAARAGEHGTGFGVVASELRKLVERTQTAASDIVRLTIGGVKTAECAGEFMSRMIPDVRRTAELAREIASTSEEQNLDAVRASKSIQQLDEVIHRNVAASRQMAATAEDLANRAKALQSTVRFFKLDEEAEERPLAALQKGAGS